MAESARTRTRAPTGGALARLTLERASVIASSQWAGLELRHLITLEAVARHRSFRKAALCLNYTQSGISQQVAALERIVGERLIERPGGSRPVGLTAAGEIVLRHAESIFHEITAAQADVGVLTRGTAGVLKVGAFQSVSAELVPELIRRLPDAQPGLTVDLVQTTADTELFALLEEGRLDVTFAILPLPQGPFEAVELFADPIVLMVSTSSPLARRREPVALDELAGLPLITSHDCRYLNGFEARMHERGYEPDVVHRTDDNGTLYGLIAGGVGAAVGPQLVADGAKGSVATLQIEEPLPPRRVALAWRRDREFPPRHEAFLELVRSVCRDLGLEPTAAAAA
jgi:DNA-binding transcriptional LysR family regulator